MTTHPGLKAAVEVSVTMVLKEDYYFEVTEIAPGYAKGRGIASFMPFVGAIPGGTTIAKAVTYRLRFEEGQESAGDRFTAHCLQSLDGKETQGLNPFPISTHQVPEGVYDAVDQYARATLVDAALASQGGSA